MRALRVLSLLALAAFAACGPQKTDPGSSGGGAGGSAGGDGGGAGGGVGGGAGGGATNSAPTLDALSPVTLAEGDTQTVTLTATDPDGDALDFSINGAPAFVTLSGNVVTVAPSFTDSGSHSVTVRVSDGAHIVDGTLAITVNNSNRAPVLTAIANRTMDFGTTSTLTLTATDPDGDAVTYALGASPAFVTLANDVLSFAPSSAQVGDYVITVSASDGQLSDQKTFQLAVRSPNVAPTILSPSQVTASGTTVSAGSLVLTAPRLRASVSDSNNEQVQLEVELVQSSVAFSGTPTHSSTLAAAAVHSVNVGTLAAGDYKWQARAKDARGATSAFIQFNGGATAFSVTPGPILGSVTINSGATWATNTTLTLALSAQSSAGTITQMRFSTDGTTWSALEPYSSSRSYPLGSTAMDGLKTIYVEFVDAAANTAQVSDTITLDRTAPLAPSLDVENGLRNTNKASVAVTITTTEPTADLQMHVSGWQNNYPPSTFSSTYTAFSSPVQTGITAGGNGQKYIWAFLKDPAGNVSPAVSYAITYDGSPPTVTGVSPAANATKVPPESSILVVFSEQLNPATVNSTNFTVSGTTGTWTWDINTRTARFSPASPLPGSVTVTVSNVTDTFGNALAAPYTFSFSTTPPLNISGSTSPVFLAPLTQSNSTGTMVVWSVDPVSTLNGAVVHWAFNDGQGWTSGSLGRGSTTNYALPAQLVSWGNRFVLSYPDAAGGYAWAIFDQGAWTVPAAPAPTGPIAANSLGVMQTQIVCGGGDCWAYASLFDGTSWGPSISIESPASASFLVNRQPGIGATDDAFVFAVGKFNAGGYWTQLKAYKNGAVTGGPTLSSSGFPGGWMFASTGSRLIAASPGDPNGVVALYNSSGWATGTQTNSGVNRLATDGAGFAVSHAYGVRVLTNTTWSTDTVLGGNVERLVGDAGKYLAVTKSPTAYTISARIFDGTTWSSPYSSPAGTSSSSVSTNGAALRGDNAVVTYLIAGTASALVHDGTGWQNQAGITPANFSGGLGAVAYGTTAGAIYGENSAYALRPLSSGPALGTQVTLHTSPLSGAASRAQVAFTSAGTGLAVWEQYDRGVQGIFAAAFDGTSWGTPFRVAQAGRVPRVASNGTSFVIVYQVPGTNPATAATWTVSYASSTLGTPFELTQGAFSYDLETAYAVASGGTDFLVVYSVQPTSGGTKSAIYRRSADGVTWSAATTLEASVYTGYYSRPYIAGNALGYIIQTNNGQNSSSQRILTTSLSAAQYVSTATCRVAAAASTFARSCLNGFSGADTSIHNGTSWGTSTTVNGGSSEVAFASNGTGYRVAYGTGTRACTGTTWSQAQSIANMDVTHLVSNGAEYGGVGLVWTGLNNVQSIGAWKSVSGVMQSVGVLEGGDSLASNPAASAAGTGYWAVWEQADERYGQTVIRGSTF